MLQALFALLRSLAWAENSKIILPKTKAVKGRLMCHELSWNYLVWTLFLSGDGLSTPDVWGGGIELAGYGVEFHELIPTGPAAGRFVEPSRLSDKES